MIPRSCALVEHLLLLHSAARLKGRFTLTCRTEVPEKTDSNDLITFSYSTIIGPSTGLTEAEAGKGGDSKYEDSNSKRMMAMIVMHT